MVNICWGTSVTVCQVIQLQDRKTVVCLREAYSSVLRWVSPSVSTHRPGSVRHITQTTSQSTVTQTDSYCINDAMAYALGMKQTAWVMNATYSWLNSTGRGWGNMAMVIEAVEEKSHCFLLQRTRLVDFIYIVFFVCLFCVWCFKTGFSQCSPLEATL